MERVWLRMVSRPLLVRGWLSLDQEREGGGLPVGLQSRERGSPCRATMEGGRNTAGGTVCV